MAATSSICEALEHSEARGNLILHSSTTKCFAEDAGAIPNGPLSYFVLDTALAPGDAHPIDVPVLPLQPLPSSGNRHRGGWAFSCWIQMAPAAVPALAETSRHARPNASLLARLTCGPLGAEAELWLQPTEVPQQFKISVRVVAASTGAFLTGKRASVAEGLVRLSTLRWHHIAVSQSLPAAMTFKSPRVAVFVDGRPAWEQDLPCPPLPFTRASFGAGLDAAMAHVAVFSERLPYLHVAAIYARGPNAGTLQHALGLPLSSAVSPELQRAGLVLPGSLDLLHDGMQATGATGAHAGASAGGAPRAAGGSGGAGARGGARSASVGKAKEAAIVPMPSVACYLDAASAVPVPASETVTAGTVLARWGGTAVSAVDGVVVDADAATTSPAPSAAQTHLGAPPRGSGAVDGASSLSAPLPSMELEVPLWWSKGEGSGHEAVTGKKKAVAAIAAHEVSMRGIVGAPPGTPPGGASALAPGQSSVLAPGGGSSGSGEYAGGGSSGGHPLHAGRDVYSARLGRGVRVVVLAGTPAATAPPSTGPAASLREAGAGGGSIGRLSGGAALLGRERSSLLPQLGLGPSATAGSVNSFFGWQAAGGIMRVVDLIRVVPLLPPPLIPRVHSTSPETPAAVGAAVAEATAALPVQVLQALGGSDSPAARYLTRHRAVVGGKVGAAFALGVCDSLHPSAATAGGSSGAPGAGTMTLRDARGDGLWHDPVASLLQVAAALLRCDYSAREEMFQLRGLAGVASLLRARVETACELISHLSRTGPDTATSDGDAQAAGRLALEAGANATTGSHGASSSDALLPHLPPAVKRSTGAAADTSSTGTRRGSAAGGTSRGGAAAAGGVGATPLSDSELRAEVLQQAVGWAQRHPISEDVWRGCADVFAACRAWGSEFGPLTLRGLRFLLGDVRLWTKPMVLGGPGLPPHLPPTPDVSAPTSEHLAHFLHVYGRTVPVDYRALLGWTRALADLAATSPLVFRAHCMTAQGACDAMVASVRAVSTALVHAQAHETLAKLGKASAGILPAPYDGMARALGIPAHPRYAFASSGAGPDGHVSVSELESALSELMQGWLSILRSLLCVSLGAPVPSRHGSGHGSYVTLGDGEPVRAVVDMGAAVHAASVLAAEHRACSLQQEALLASLRDAHGKGTQFTPLLPGAVQDPFARAACGVVDMLDLMLRSYPYKSHPPFEAANGVAMLLSVAEADAEPLRVSALGGIAAVIALRRSMDPRLYGDDCTAAAEGAPAGTGASSDAPAGALPTDAGPVASGASSLASAPTRAMVMSARDRQTRLLRLVAAALADRPSTTTASAIVALQLVLAPELTGEGRLGTAFVGSGGSGRGGVPGGGRARTGTASGMSLLDEIIPSTPLASPPASSTAHSPIAVMDDPDAPQPGTPAFRSSVLCSSAVTGGASITCGEALPLVFTLLGQAAANLQAHLPLPAKPSVLSCLPVGPTSGGGDLPRARRAGTWPLELARWSLADLPSFTSAEGESRMRVMLDTSLLIRQHGAKGSAGSMGGAQGSPGGGSAAGSAGSTGSASGTGGGPSNSLAFMRQAGWQSLLLDHMYLPAAPRLTAVASYVPLTGAGGSAADAFAAVPTYDPSSASAAASPYIDDGPTGNSPFETSNNAISALAGDCLSVLLGQALEMENGWRVWVSTLSCLHERYRRDAGTAALRAALLPADSLSSLSADVGYGLASVLVPVLERMGRERPRVLGEVRVNLLRTLRLAASRLCGVPLAKVVIAAIPVIEHLRDVARQQAHAAAEAAAKAMPVPKPGQQLSAAALASAQQAAALAALAAVPPDTRVDPLRGQEVWLVLELLTRSLQTLSGVAPLSSMAVPTSLGGAQPAGAPGRVGGILLRPHPRAFADAMALLQGLISDELPTLPDPDAAASGGSGGGSSGLGSAGGPYSGGGLPSRDLGAAFKTALTRVGSAVMQVMPDDVQVPGSGTGPSSSQSGSDYDVIPGQGSRAGSGTRVDALMYVLCGLQRAMAACGAHLSSQEGGSTSPASSASDSGPKARAVSEEIQTLCVVLALAVVNNSRWGPWEQAIASFKDEAYMRGEGRHVPPGARFRAADVGLPAPGATPVVTPARTTRSSRFANAPELLPPAAKRGLGGAYADDEDEDDEEGAVEDVTSDMADVTIGGGGGGVGGLRSPPVSTRSLSGIGAPVSFTNVPPTPLDRCAAVFDVLELAVRDIRSRMEGAATGQLTVDPAPLSGEPATPARLVSISIPAGTVAAAAGSERAPWLRELLSSESRPAPQHPVLVPADEAPLLAALRSALASESSRLTRADSEAASRLRMVQQHWVAVRMGLSRAGRLRRAGRAWAAAHSSSSSSGGTSGLLASEDYSVALTDDMLGAGEDGEKAERRRRANSVGGTTVSSTSGLSMYRPGHTGTDGREAVLPPMKIDSHEDRSRARNRLLSAKKPPLLAPTYAEFGKMSGRTGPAYGGAVVPAPAPAPSESSVSDVARKLAKAGAIKDVATQQLAETGPRGGDDDEDRDDDALRAASAESDDDEEEAAARRERAGSGDDGDDDGDDGGSETASESASTLTSEGEGMLSVDESSTVGGAISAPAAARSAAALSRAYSEPDDLIESNMEALAHAAAGPRFASAQSGGSGGGAHLGATHGSRGGSLGATASAANLDHLRGISARASLVKVGGYSPGTLTLIGDSLVWTPRPPGTLPDPDDDNAHLPDPDAVFPPRRLRRWAVSHITAIFLRCFRLTDSAAEFFVAAYAGPRKRRYFLAFEGGASARDDMIRRVVERMPRSVLERVGDRLGVSGSSLDVGVNAGTGAGASIFGGTSGNGVGHAYLQIPRPPPMGSGSGASSGFAHNYEYRFRLVMGELVTAWRSRRLSNFDYLMALNTLAGRSFNDLTQYPVFPWVIADYASSVLDLADPSSYRDLSRPMGAMTSERLREFRGRYATFDDDTIPKFLYGSHYSTAVGTVVHYLLRCHPFTHIHVAYQDGHFDVADRLFSSVADAWAMNTTNLSEVKEITPEWYSQAHFLANGSRYNFGTLQDGVRVDHVRLPPWARGSPAAFVRTMRAALESEWVSSQIHAWVDLVFGYKQRGPAAVAADNVFYYLTYAGGVDIDAIEDPGLRKATQSQITHYGQTPLQLLRMPHVARGPHPVPPPQFIPASPASAGLAALASGSLLGGAADASRRAQADELATAAAAARKRAGGIGAVRNALVAAAAAGARVVAAGAAAVVGGRGASGDGALAGSARPLILELRRFAQVLGKLPIVRPEVPLASGMLVSLSESGSATAVSVESLAHHVASLPFQLVPNRAFSHVASIPSAGCSFWRPDAPSSLPLALQMMFGGPASVAALLQATGTQASSGSTGQFKDGLSSASEPPYLHLSLGDAMALGGAPPPATLSVRVLATAVDAVVNTSGPRGTSWFTATADSKPAPASPASPAGAPPKPFALPLRFHMVCELSGTAAAAPFFPSASDAARGDVDRTAGSSGAGGSADSADGDAADEAVPEEVTLPPTRFHLWWPVAPCGYVALGCVVTADTTVRIPVAPAPTVPAQQDATQGAPGGPGAGSQPGSAPPRPSGPAAPAPALAYITRTKPTPPDLDAVVCVHAGLVTPALLTGFTPLPWLALNIPANQPQDVLRGWTSGGKRGKAGSIDAPTEYDVTAASGAPSLSSDVIRGWGSPTSAGGEPDADASSSAAEAPWVVPNDGQDASGMPAADSSAARPLLPHADGEGEDGDGGFDGDAHSDRGSVDVAAEQAAAAAAAASNTAGSAIAQASSGSMVAKVGRLRALRSRGMALYGVSNRVGTFVTPVPHSLQRAAALQGGQSVALDAAVANGSEGMQDLLGILDAGSSASGAGSPDEAAAVAASSSGLLLAPTPLAPVPEPADATYFKAHSLCAAAAYELGPALLSKVAAPAAPGEVKATAAALGAAMQQPSLAPPRFHNQHWSADAVTTAAAPVMLPAAAVSDEARLGYRVGLAAPSARYAPAGMPPAHSRGGLSQAGLPGMVEVRPHIVAVRVLAPAPTPASGGLAGLQRAPGATSALPHTVVAVDAAGNVHRLRVTVEATHAPSTVTEHVDALSATVAQLMGLPSGQSTPGSPRALLHESDSGFQLLPHVRVKLVRDATVKAAHLPLVPLVNVAHPLSLQLPATKSAAGQAALTPSQIPSLVSFPVCLGDLVCGAIVTTGCGRGGRGFEMHSIDVRLRAAAGPRAPGATGATQQGATSSGAVGGVSGGAPPVPLGPKASASTQVKRTINSTVTAVGNFAAGTTGAPEIVPEVPSWAGGSPGSDTAIVGAASVPSCRPGVGGLVTALASDSDVLCVGFGDGSLSLWRVSGVDALSSLISWPSLRPRPDVHIRSPGAGAVTCVAVSRDDDAAVIGYEGEAWVVELSRGRQLQCIPLSVTPAAVDLGVDPAVSVLTTPVCTGAAITAEGGIVLAASSAVLKPAQGADGSAATLRPSGFVSELTLYDSSATASPLGPPVARAAIPARVMCVARVRGGGTGDIEGPGALIAVGRGDGVVTLYDGRNLAPLVSWETPNRAAAFSLDVSPCTGYLVAGCANGTVAAFALPALPATVSVLMDLSPASGAAGQAGAVPGGVAGALAVGAAAAAVAQVERAKGLARTASQAATAGVKGLFSIFGGRK